MNPLEKIEKAVRAMSTAFKFRRDLAAKPSGTSYLDVIRGDYELSVEYRPGHGFGVTAPASEDDGTGPEEVFKDELRAVARVLELLDSRGKTFPRRETTLRRLREIRRLTQEELADKLDVKQATVSKLEGRNDQLLVSTLRRVVGALGGELELVAKFPDGQLVLDLEPEAATGGRRK